MGDNFIIFLFLVIIPQLALLLIVGFEKIIQIIFDRDKNKKPAEELPPDKEGDRGEEVRA